MSASSQPSTRQAMQVSLERAPGPVPASAPYYNLGTHRRAVSTASPDAQAWFDRGLVWAYAFNHREAYACFKQVVAHDPGCAMGYWGAAFALGPNHNKVWAAFDEEDRRGTMRDCWELVRRAREVCEGASPVERALVEALGERFPGRDVPEDLRPSVYAYAEAMRQVYKRFGKVDGGDLDLDVLTLTADALIGIAPWKLYSSATGEPDLSTPVLEVKALLEVGLADRASRYHPGLLHMYIHCVEMSSTPELAVLPADQLRDLVPEAGHVTHMPSHIDVLVGDYRRALRTNLAACAADDLYAAREGAANFYSTYRMHNYHSLVYAAMLAGHRALALEGVDRMERALTPAVLRIESPPMADWLEAFGGVRAHVYVRFGMWAELKALEVPADAALYCCTAATVHYGRAVAHAATGDVRAAERAREEFRAAAARVPASRIDFPNRVVDVLGVAAAMLDGELAYRKGEYEVAFGHLRVAVERDDGLLYSEPWAWMMPTRHALGALLLERGRVAEAAKLYAEDLGLLESGGGGAGGEGRKKLARAHQHPNNVWALHGYRECLVKLGGREGEVALVGKLLEMAAAGADVDVKASCFCRADACAGGEGEEKGMGDGGSACCSR